MKLLGDKSFSCLFAKQNNRRGICITVCENWRNGSSVFCGKENSSLIRFFYHDNFTEESLTVFSCHFVGRKMFLPSLNIRRILFVLWSSEHLNGRRIWEKRWEMVFSPYFSPFPSQLHCSKLWGAQFNLFTFGIICSSFHFFSNNTSLKILSWVNYFKSKFSDNGDL